MTNVELENNVGALRLSVTDVEPSIRASEFSSIISGTTFGLQLAASMALTMGERQFHPTTHVATASAIVQYERVHYGSPIEIFVNLEPILRTLSDNGYIVFAGIASLLFERWVNSWKTLEEARKLRRERLRERPGSLPSRAEVDATQEFIEPLALQGAELGGEFDNLRNVGFLAVTSLSHAEAEAMSRHTVKVEEIPFQ